MGRHASAHGKRSWPNMGAQRIVSASVGISEIFLTSFARLINFVIFRAISAAPFQADLGFNR
jgi:hypothetical protein